MDAGVLDMLRNGVFDDFALVGDGIELDFLRFLHKLRDDDGKFLRHLCRHIQEAMQFLVVVADVHRRA